MQQKMFSKINRKEVIKINFIIRLNRKVKLWNQKGQSTLEYALVVVIAGIISAILLAVGKPIIIDTISKVFSKIASMV